MGRLIFLDFDGVLRRVTSNPSGFNQDCLEFFENAVRQCPVSKIVITSTWRLAMPLKEMRGLFSHDIALRIVGITPESFEAEDFNRHAEVLMFMAEKNISAMPWIAIDDDPEHYPFNAPLLLVDPNTGFDQGCHVRLVKTLLG